MYSPPKLMQSFKQYGELLIYKNNIGKTQLVSYIHNPPEEMQCRLLNAEALTDWRP